jgi:hypothetical protein
MSFKSIILIITTAIIACSCSITQPRLSYSGGNYNSVSDDIIIYNALQESISKISNALNADDRILLIRVVNNDKNDYIADRIFEELYKSGYVVAVTNNDELKTTSIEAFDKFLMFYPTVYGTETSVTEPTLYPKLFAAVPIIGWIAGPSVLSSYSYIDRQAGVVIHCRLVDAQSGEIVWIKDFSGQDKIKLDRNTIHEIFPNE